MPQEPRQFVLTSPMYGYLSNDRRTAYQLGTREVYTATYVGKNHALVIHPERPNVELLLPLKSEYWWKRIKFTPEECGLAALFNEPRPTQQP